MSDSTLISSHPGYVLDPEQVVKVLREIQDIEDIVMTTDRAGRESVEAWFRWRQGGKPWKSPLRLGADHGHVSIRGSGDDALTFAVEFGSRYIAATGTPLDVFNEGYDFHQGLSADLDLATLKQRIAENPHAGAEASCYQQPKEPPHEDECK